MSSKRSRRPQCSQDGCASRRFNVGDDGYTYCDRGHQQSELGTVIAEDTGELVIQGTKSRKKDSDAESFASRVSGFSGTKAFEHYLLCVQLVLRKQLRWLIDVQKLPEELETLVRDLWALRLQKVQSRVSYDSETDTEAQSSQMFSSQSEGDTGTDGKTVNSQRAKQNARKIASGPGLMDLLCLIFTGFMLLRIPLTIADLTKWINDGELCYYRASKEIPLSMRERLPGHLQEQLEPQDLVAPETLQRKVLEWLTTLAETFGMAVPPINHPLVLYRWVKQLCLPLEIMVGAQRLGRVLNVDYAYRLDAKAGTLMSLRFPEIRLMALVVITTKLLFPLDNNRRYPKASNDLAALRMDWKIWHQQQQLQASKPLGGDESEARLSYQEAFSMTEGDSLDLAGDALDQYLDWCESNIASEEVRERGRAGREADFRRALFRMFPSSSDRDRSTRVETRGDHGDSSAERIQRVQGALRPERIVSSEGGTDDVPRAGSSYPQYRAEDELEGISRAFYESAAQLAGISLHGMLRAVFSMERRLMEREKALRRASDEREEGSPSMSTTTSM